MTESRSTARTIEAAIIELEQLCEIWLIDKHHCAFKMYEMYSKELDEHKSDLAYLENRTKKYI